MIAYDEALRHLLDAAVPLPPERVPLERAEGRVLASDVLSILGCCLLLCLMASLYPAWRASRLDPLTILRLS